MQEQISVDFNSLKKMTPEALDFFLDEIAKGNSILITEREETPDATIKTNLEWNQLLLDAGLTQPKEKKQYRI